MELAGPTILAFGTEEQKAKFLPGIANGTQIWCQGYSEPNAGSDLANVRTKARLEGDEWVVNGQKVWTSLAHYSDWIFVVARSEEGSKGPKGLTFLMMDMHQPGSRFAHQADQRRCRIQRDLLRRCPLPG